MFFNRFIVLQSATFLAKYQHTAMHDKMQIYARKNIIKFLIVKWKTDKYHNIFFNTDMHMHFFQ